MLVRSNNNTVDEKDSLAIGQKQYRETNPFGYKDYKESFDKDGWWKKVEYTDENGENVVKEINPFGQELIHQFVNIRENTDEIELDKAIKATHKKKRNFDEELEDDLELLEKWAFDDQEETKNEQRLDCYGTPEKEIDVYNLSRNDFFRMDWRETQYQLYKLLVSISSSLHDIQEVAADGNK